MQDGMISIEGLDKADVLMALFNAECPIFPGGVGNPANLMRMLNPQVMEREEAEALLEQRTYFDYVRGRVMKVKLEGDAFDPWLYDRDNGEGAAARAIGKLRKSCARSRNGSAVMTNIDGIVFCFFFAALVVWVVTMLVKQ